MYWREPEITQNGLILAVGAVATADGIREFAARGRTVYEAKRNVLLLMLRLGASS